MRIKSVLLPTIVISKQGWGYEHKFKIRCPKCKKSYIIIFNMFTEEVESS